MYSRSTRTVCVWSSVCFKLGIRFALHFTFSIAFNANACYWSAITAGVYVLHVCIKWTAVLCFAPCSRCLCILRTWLFTPETRGNHLKLSINTTVVYGTFRASDDAHSQVSGGDCGDTSGRCFGHFFSLYVHLRTRTCEIIVFIRYLSSKAFGRKVKLVRASGISRKLTIWPRIECSPCCCCCCCCSALWRQRCWRSWTSRWAESSRRYTSDRCSTTPSSSSRPTTAERPQTSRKAPAVTSPWGVSLAEAPLRTSSIFRMHATVIWHCIQTTCAYIFTCTCVCTCMYMYV